jgi:hypothetical protein
MLAAASGGTPVMILRILRHAAWPALSAAAIASGCSSKAAPAEAYVVTSLQPGGAGVCREFAQQTTLIQVGVATGTQPTTVPDGGSQAGAQVTVSCTVHPDSGGYDIDLSAELVGQGAISVHSTGSGTVTASGGMGLTATFAKSLGGSGHSYTASDCTLTYMYNRGPVPNMMPIASGRIWAHVSCLDAQAMTDNVIDGGTVPEVCDAEADFLFENCSE